LATFYFDWLIKGQVLLSRMGKGVREKIKNLTEKIKRNEKKKIKRSS
jgi:hypothetical protein